MEHKGGRRKSCPAGAPVPPLWIFSWDYFGAIGPSGSVKKKQDCTSRRHSDPGDKTLF